MEHMRTIESDLPTGVTLPEYRRMIRPNRPKRHSPIRRFISFGLLR